MAKMKIEPNPPIYQLKITLQDVKPPIWRRVLVRQDIKLNDLHEVIQMVMGWDCCHLHQFVIDGVDYGELSPDGDDFGMEIEDESRFRLCDLAEEKGKFLYDYDFGDGWRHVIEVEKVLPPDPKVFYPVCVKGKRSCPPEDCGGPWGYENLLEILADPKHEEHEDYMEWIGGEFDPEEFDLEEINAELKVFFK